MADAVQAYLDSLEEEYNRPMRARNLMPKPAAGLAVTVSLAAGQGNPVNAGPVNFTVTFNKPVTGFTSAGVSFVGSTVGGTLAAAVTGGPSVYNVAVTGMTGNGLVAVSTTAGAGVDATNVPSPASVAVFVTFDTTRPNVTINVAAGQLDPATVAGAAINFTAVFTEAVTGFASADISFTGSTVTGTLAATISGGPATYNVAVTGMTGTTGNVVVTIPANGCTDLAGNLNFASTSTDNSVAYAPDLVAPTVTINQAGGQADPAGTSPILFTAVFSEAVTGFTSGDISFAGSTAGGTLAAAISGGPATYTVTVTGMTTPGNVVASIPAGVVIDVGANPNTASTSTDNTVLWTAGDATRPAPAIDRDISQADPTSVGPIIFFVGWSEPVTGFTSASISFTGSTVGGTLVAVVALTSPTTYSVTVTGMTTAGNVVASIPANVCTDLAGNLNIASVSTDNVVAWTVGGGPSVQTYFFITGQY